LIQFLPGHQCRTHFYMLPTDTQAGWQTISSTMAALPTSIAGYRESLRYARDQLGRVPARLQIERVADQAEALSRADSRFATIAADATSATTETLARELAGHARSAAEAFGDLASFLRTELSEHAPENEACGREDYALFSRE